MDMLDRVGEYIYIIPSLMRQFFFLPFSFLPSPPSPPMAFFKKNQSPLLP